MPVTARGKAIFLRKNFKNLTLDFETFSTYFAVEPT